MIIVKGLRVAVALAKAQEPEYLRRLKKSDYVEPSPTPERKYI